MRQNSVYVDQRLFPSVEELTVLDASTIFDSRLRGAEGPHTLRLDIYSVAWDGVSILGTDTSHLIGRRLPPHKGASRLRHALGTHAEAFTHIVIDPSEPDVVFLIGPSPVPKEYGEELKLTTLEDLLEASKFLALDNVTKASMAMLKYVSTNNPNKVGATVLDLGNGWVVECVTLLGEAPVFFVRPTSHEDVIPGRGFTISDGVISDHSFVRESCIEGHNLEEELRDEW